MPTIFFINGWRVFFFADEGNEPIHVHCQKAEARCKYWIMKEKHDIQKAYAFGMSARDVREIRKIIFKNFDTIVETWDKFQERKK